MRSTPEFLETMLNGKLRRLHYTWRYSTYPVNKQENVAEHQGQVCLFSALLAWHYQQSTGETLDTAKLMMRAAVHDVEECITGDVVRNVKHSKALHAAVDHVGAEACLALDQKLGLDGLMFEAWENAKDESLEGEVLAVADVLCVVAYLLQEEELGSIFARELRRECWQWMCKIRDGRLKHEYPLMVCNEAIDLLERGLD